MAVTFPGCGEAEHGHLCHLCWRWGAHACGRMVWTRLGWCHERCFLRIQHPDWDIEPTLQEIREGVRP